MKVAWRPLIVYAVGPTHATLSHAYTIQSVRQENDNSPTSVNYLTRIFAEQNYHPATVIFAADSDDEHVC